MKKKSKPLNVLYIEDDTKDYTRLNSVAENYRIVLTHETNLEDGIKTFREKKGETYFDGIILDALCLIKRDDHRTSNKFVMQALKEFRSIAPSLLKIIFTNETAIAQDFRKYFDEKEDVRIFDKSSHSQTVEMLSVIVNSIRNKEDNIIISRYKKVFEVFDSNCLDNEAKEELLRCLKDMQGSDYTTIKNSLGCLRRLQEKVYIALNRINPDMVPKQFMVPDNSPGSKVQVRAIYKHLTEKKFVDRYSIIDTFASSIYSISSDNGAHTPYIQPYYHPTEYTVQAITFAIMDMLLWLKEVAEKNNNKGHLKG